MHIFERTMTAPDTLIAPRPLVDSIARTGNTGDCPTFPISMNNDTAPRMVLDTEIHWIWSNPLNVIPATLLVLAVLGIVMMLLNLLGA